MAEVFYGVEQELKFDADADLDAKLQAEIAAYARTHGCSEEEALAALINDPDFLSRWEVLFPDERNSNMSKLMKQLQGMGDIELEKFAAQHGVMLSHIEFNDLDHVRRYIAEELKVERPSNAHEAQTFEAGAELDRIAQTIKDEHDGWSYEKCLGIARQRRADLAKKAFPAKRIA